MSEQVRPLSEVLTWLLGHAFRKNHQLGRERKKKDGLWLSWMPPSELRISRPRVVPSPNELRIVENHLRALGYTVTVSPLKKGRSQKTGEDWFWYRLAVVHQPGLV